MSALPNTQPGVDTVHHFHADASVFDVDLEQPIRTNVKRRALVKLPENGRIKYKRAAPYQLKGLISYEGGYTQVAGHPSTKMLGGFTTVSTTVLEGLNVLDVLTADRVVGQISTVHPPYDSAKGLTDAVPSVSFLGTRFENLRIDGHEVFPERQLDILGEKPPNARSYFEDDKVLANIEAQYQRINDVAPLPEWAAKRYVMSRSQVQSKVNNGKKRSFLECSVVGGIPEAPGKRFGHVIDLPHFGKIFLGELTIDRVPGKPATSKSGLGPDTYIFHLKMIRLELGCLASGTATVGTIDTNGTGGKGGH